LPKAAKSKENRTIYSTLTLTVIR